MEIQIHNLKKIYNGTTVLDIPELKIASGEIVSLVGNNGAGKTTLLRLILDLIRADDGQVLSGGALVIKSANWKNYTGSYIDGRFLIDFLTPEEYFSFIADVYGISKVVLKERLQAYEELMHGEILGMKKLLKDYSQGNRQKVGIMGAMLINPTVLVLDEPFNYLDPSSQQVVAREILKLNKLLGTTVILSTHNLSWVTDISSRILLLEKGHVIKDVMDVNEDSTAEIKDYFETYNS